MTVAVGTRGLELRAELAHIPAQIAAGTGLTDTAAAAALIETLQRLTETMHAVAAHPTNDTIAITISEESHK